MSTITIAEKSNWVDRPNKRANDQHQFRVINQVLPVDKEHKCLVLPADAWTWEYNLASMNPNRTWLFHGLQPDKANRANLHDRGYKFNQLFHDKYKSKTTFITEKSKTEVGLYLENYVAKTENKFSLIYADWCGGMVSKNEGAINSIFARQLLEDDSVLILTVQPDVARQAKNPNRVFLKLKTRFNSSEKVDDPALKYLSLPAHKIAANSINDLVKMVAANNEYNIALVHHGFYKGDLCGVDMFTFTYHVKKNKA